MTTIMIDDDKNDDTTLREQMLSCVAGHPALDQLSAHEIALTLLTVDHELLVVPIRDGRQARLLICESCGVPKKIWKRFTKSAPLGYARVVLLDHALGVSLALVEQSPQARITCAGGAA